MGAPNLFQLLFHSGLVQRARLNLSVEVNRGGGAHFCARAYCCLPFNEALSTVFESHRFWSKFKPTTVTETLCLKFVGERKKKNLASWFCSTITTTKLLHSPSFSKSSSGLLLIFWHGNLEIYVDTLFGHSVSFVPPHFLS